MRTLTYMHIEIHTCTRTYMRTLAYMHTYMHVDMHTCTLTYMRACMHTYIHKYIDTYSYLHVHPYAYWSYLDVKMFNSSCVHVYTIYITSSVVS